MEEWIGGGDRRGFRGKDWEEKGRETVAGIINKWGGALFYIKKRYMEKGS